MSTILFKSHDKEAFIPTRAGKDEVGFDLTIIQKVKDFLLFVFCVNKLTLFSDIINFSNYL